MTTHAMPLSISHHIAMKIAILTPSRRGVAAFLLATLCLQGAVSQAAETAAPPAFS